ncbi:putative glucan 1,4-alpha-glucosidase [Aspergillus clavatus NRRL 1]|uniref:Glucoamylase n=1 Tax=Aspergillus clavatus (strain ATCC 1007 / CBS 513.65 / DSM 816 / NCTC 3887 / NRRL 1 / QM 1276 / 107) TaxID=344612 RepID=A1CLY4_ASPCL|nr:glucan 1,4-alpha-glucosidase, putative [Aspergillus clavatus NRRL 1]EAW09113.1 glucan 1,4-alpha-glucosidase, putative [Aspergillus clavatus NRRL 1]
MRFLSTAVGIASVLGQLAGASPVSDISERSLRLEAFIAKEGLLSYQNILKAIGNTGSNAPGTAAGLFIASPSLVNPDYFFTWTRDSALTIQGLIEIFLTANNFLGIDYQPLKGHIQDYISSQAILQNVTNPSGGLSDGAGLGEPKFEVNLNPYTGAWGRPQRDGPALRAIAMLTYMQHLIKKGEKSVASDLVWPVVANDLAYVAQYWNSTGFDLWEEVDGSSFFTSAAQHRAMVEASTVAKALGKPFETYDAIAPQILCFLQTYWNGKNIVSNINTNNGRTGIDLNSVLTSIHMFDPEAGCDDATFQPCSSKALANHKVYVDSFRSIYTANAGRGKGQPANVGRYPEDVYQGGNPWYLATLAAAEQLYDALYVWRKQGSLTVTEISLPFFRDFSDTIKPGTYRANSATYQSLTRAVGNYADGFTSLVQESTPRNGSLAEQYTRDTGAPISAGDLTWSYAAFLSAVQRRASIVPGSWGAGRANTVPATCKAVTVRGTYAVAKPPFPFSSTKCIPAKRVPVTFWLTASTYWGQNVFMTGNTTALGNWNTTAGYALSSALYTEANQLWVASVEELKPGETIEYRFYKVEPDRSITWESTKKRVYTVPTGCPMSPQLTATW